MSNLGNYRNPEIQVLLNRFITEEQYGDYKPIIDEIIQRRAFEYKFSPQRIENELQNLVSNLKGFEMADEEKLSEMGEGCIGAYSINDKKIFINGEYFKEVEVFFRTGMDDIDVRWSIGRRAFHTLTHEIYHAINQKENKDIGLFYKDEYGMRTGNMMNELVTESAARRTLLLRTDEERQKGYVQTEYYEALTSTTALLANSIGVSENNLLAHGLNDRKEFDDFVFENLPKTMPENERKSFLSGIFFKVGIINSVIQNASPEITASSFKSYYKSFFNMAIDCMKEEQKNPTKESVGAMHYRAGRIWRITTFSLQNLEDIGFISKEDKDTILNDPDFLGKFDELQGIVLDTYKLQKGESFEGKSDFEIEQALLQDMLRDPDYLQKRNELYKEDNLPEGFWDNSVFMYTYNVIADELKKQEQNRSVGKVLEVAENTTGQILEAINVDPNLLTSQKPRNLEDDDDDGR